MKKIIINENKERMLFQNLINENIEGEAELIKNVTDYLDKHYFGGYADGVDGAKYKPTIIYLVKDNNGQPIKDKPRSKETVFYQIQKEFPNCKNNEKERDKFLWDVMTHWYNKDITKHGNLPS